MAVKSPQPGLPPSQTTSGAPIAKFTWQRFKQMLRIPVPLPANLPLGMTWYGMLLFLLVPSYIGFRVIEILQVFRVFSMNQLHAATSLIRSGLPLSLLVMIWISMAWRKSDVVYRVCLHLFVLYAMSIIDVAYAASHAILTIEIIAYTVSNLAAISIIWVPTIYYLKKRVPYYFLG